MLQISNHPTSATDTAKTASGFSMLFKNGYSISVQFGYGCYSENKQQSKESSANAEVAIFAPNGEFVPLPNTGDTACGYLPADEVANLIEYAKNL